MSARDNQGLFPYPCSSLPIIQQRHVIADAQIVEQEARLGGIGFEFAGHLIDSFDGTNTTSYLTDAEGSVLTSFSQSAVTGEQIYGPYGNTSSTAGTINTAKGYTR